MNLSEEVKEKFKLQEEHGLNGNGAAKTEVKKKKVISQEELNLNLQQVEEMLDETELNIKEADIDPSEVARVFETIITVIQQRIPKLKGEDLLSHRTENRLTTDSTSPAAEKKSPEEKNLIEYVYDFETFPPLTCKFLGEGPEIIAEGRPLKTWKVEEIGTDKTQWFIPRWAIFSEVQGSFLGFQAEQPGKYIYHMEYKGVQQLPNKSIKFMVQILKKFPG